MLRGAPFAAGLRLSGRMAGENDLALDSTWSVVELCAGRGEYSSRMTEVARFDTGARSCPLQTPT